MWILVFLEIVILLASVITFVVFRKKEGFFKSGKQFVIYTSVLLLIALVIGFAIHYALFHWGPFFRSSNYWSLFG